MNSQKKIISMVLSNKRILKDLFEYFKIQHFNLPCFVFETLGEVIDDIELIKIEERELSTEERNQWFHINWNANNPLMKSDWKFYELDQQNVPTKLITITYKDEKIEVYE